MIERVSNVHRKRKSEGDGELLLLSFCNSTVYVGATPSKRGRPKKSSVSLSERYPALTTTSDVNGEEEKTAYDELCAEMKTSKPRRDIFLTLMKNTFAMRRHYILNCAVSVQSILQEYPALKEPAAVSHIIHIF